MQNCAQQRNFSRRWMRHHIENNTYKFNYKFSDVLLNLLWCKQDCLYQGNIWIFRLPFNSFETLFEIINIKRLIFSKNIYIYIYFENFFWINYSLALPLYHYLCICRISTSTQLQEAMDILIGIYIYTFLWNRQSELQRALIRLYIIFFPK